MAAPKKDEIPLNNPAARLLNLVEEVKRKSAAIPGNQNPSVENCFYEIFQVSAPNRSQLLAVVAPIFSIPREIREAVARHDGMSHELLLQWVPRVENTLANLHLPYSFRDFANAFDDTTVYGMKFCADYLARRAPEKVLASEDVVSLAGEIAEIKNLVVEADLPYELKRFLLVHLDAVEIAIREYRLCGTLPLEQALNAAVGAAVTNRAAAEKSYECPEGKRVWRLLGKLHTILGCTWNVMQIGDSAGKTIAQLLPPN